MDKKLLGETFRTLRINRHISLKQVATADLSISQLSRFERGESELSISKFLIALNNIHVEVKEFMDAASGFQHTEQIRFMSELIDLEYKRDVAGFQRLQTEQLERFKHYPNKERYKLNSILLQGFICKCDPTIPFPKESLDTITDYLFATENWNIYELALIGNLYLFIDIPLLHRMGQEILKRRDYYREIATHRHMVVATIMNIWETCIHRNVLDIADFYQEQSAALLTNETKLYEKTIFLFLKGLQAYRSGQTLPGIEDMTHAIQIFDWLDCPHMVDNYKTDFARFVK
ncbi:Rgg family transcriptional regulator [Streptococcus cameli]